MLTNDGELARFLELPSSKFQRIYRVRVKGKVSQEKLDMLKDGIKINNITYRKVNTKIIKQMNSNAWLEVSIEEGKNREIRKIMSYFGYSVNKLIRIAYGPFYLGQLKPGELIKVNCKKIGL